MSTEQPAQPQPQPQTADTKKVGSDGEDFSDTVNEITNFEVSFYADCFTYHNEVVLYCQ